MITLALAVVMGFTLGLLGGGGSILAVPILVYVAKLDPKTAIALSLGIVGTVALLSSIGHFKKGNFEVKALWSFAPTSLVGASLGAYLAKYISSGVQLTAFSVIMIVASVFMFKKPNLENQKQSNLIALLISGFGIGILTGIVGVGGGFLLVPALVLLANVDMKKAVGTSLFLIFLNAVTGFSVYLKTIDIDWSFFTTFTALAVVGSYIGIYFSTKVPQQTLKKVFGIFLIVLGTVMVLKNTL